MGILVIILALIIGATAVSNEEIRTTVSERFTEAGKILDKQKDVKNDQSLSVNKIQNEEETVIASSKEMNTEVRTAPLFTDGTEIQGPGIQREDRKAAELSGKLPPIDNAVIAGEEQILDEEAECIKVAKYARSVAALNRVGVKPEDIEEFSSGGKVATFPIKSIQRDVYERKFTNPDSTYIIYHDVCLRTGYDNLVNILRSK